MFVVACNSCYFTIWTWYFSPLPSFATTSHTDCLHVALPLLHLRLCGVMYIITPSCGFENMPASSQSAVTGGLQSISRPHICTDAGLLICICSHNNNNNCVGPAGCRHMHLFLLFLSLSSPFLSHSTSTTGVLCVCACLSSPFSFLSYSPLPSLSVILLCLFLFQCYGTSGVSRLHVSNTQLASCI